MEATHLQTLHPQAGKTNKRILREKYNVIKTHIRSILSEGAFTHTELMRNCMTK